MNIFKASMVKVGMVVFVAAASVAVAQPQAQSQGELQQLRQEAQRLMVLQALPEEAQAEAEGLLEQSQTLRDSAITLRTERMQAFVTALEAGEAPLVARELANQSVSDARLALLRDVTAFRAEVDAFLDTYPEARGALGRFRGAWQGWQRGWDEDTDFGAGAQFGGQPGMMQRGNRQHRGQPGGQFGQQYGQGYGNQPGMMQRGNRHNRAQRGMMQRGNAEGNYRQGRHNNTGAPQQ